jgi:hypothetical protein
MWLWVNVHGTFALGFVYLGLHVAGRWLDGSPPWQGRERVLIQAAVLAFVLCLVNPYGPALLVFPVELLARGDILRRVTEWRSPDFRSIQGLTLAAWLAVLVSCLALGRHRPSRRDVLVAVPFTLLALWAQRNIAIAPLVGLPVVARAVSAREARSESDAPIQRVMAAFVLALGVLWTAQAAAEPSFNFRIYPVKAMDFVATHDLLGRRLMTDDAWGGYLILEWPTQKVFVDDRYDMYPVAITKDFIRFSDADRRWREILDKYRIDVVVWKQDQPVVRLLDTDLSWELVYRDKTAVVYVRRPPGPGA